MKNLKVVNNLEKMNISKRNVFNSTVQTIMLDCIAQLKLKIIIMILRKAICIFIR